MIARRYARALYRYALEEKVAEEVYEAMKAFDANAYSHPDLHRALGNPMLAPEKKERLIVAAIGREPGEALLKFIRLLITNHRETYMRLISFVYQKIYREANGIVKDYTIQGWAIDSDRLKSGGSVLTREYFDHLLEQIREIRMSERRFYQKITDIYATALDYDKSAKTTRLFFAEVQNKLHWAIHRHTAAELIMERANAEKPHMGLTSWEQYPDGKIQKYDVSIAKNYLSKEELQALERIVTMYLDYAEYQASRHIPMTMQDWSQRLNRFLEFNEHEILHDTGRVTHEIAKAFAESEFEKYRVVQDRLFESDFDRFLTLEKEAERHNNEES